MLNFRKTFLSTALAGTLALSGATAFADDNDDPTAYLYNATCADLDAATDIEEIEELERDDDDDTNRIWEKLGTGETMPDGILAEKDDVGNFENVQELIDGDYAVVVHEHEEDSDVIACGDVEGELTDDTLLIQLNEVGASGFEGRALLTPDFDDDDDDDDNDIDIAVAIYPAGSVKPIATPAS